LLFYATPLCGPCLWEKVKAQPSGPDDILTIPMFDHGSYRLYWSGSRRHMAIAPEFMGAQQNRGDDSDTQEKSLRRKIVH
jgi:hypothetical protein